MQFTTPVIIPPSPWHISPCEPMLFVGSCFADNMGKRFTEDKFRTLVNPYGVMYNPVSIGHTVSRAMTEGILPFTSDREGTAVFTLGTNHVYILKETGEVVDNCMKRPQQLFREEELSVEQCVSTLTSTISLLHKSYPKVRFILTVSPIRYRKYGYHESQLSKAILLLAIDQLVKKGVTSTDKDLAPALISYFPAYEIMHDELRDYRFYKEDMLHPSDQAVQYIYERFAETMFSQRTHEFVRAWQPIKAALGHRPLAPESEEYRAFLRQTEEKARRLQMRFPELSL